MYGHMNCKKSLNTIYEINLQLKQFTFKNVPIKVIAIKSFFGNIKI